MISLRMFVGTTAALCMNRNYTVIATACLNICGKLKGGFPQTTELMYRILLKRKLTTVYPAHVGWRWQDII